jgi:hypothetical protein
MPTLSQTIASLSVKFKKKRDLGQYCTTVQVVLVFHAELWTFYRLVALGSSSCGWLYCMQLTLFFIWFSLVCPSLLKLEETEHNWLIGSFSRNADGVDASHITYSLSLQSQYASSWSNNVNKNKTNKWAGSFCEVCRDEYSAVQELSYARKRVYLPSSRWRAKEWPSVLLPKLPWKFQFSHVHVPTAGINMVIRPRMVPEKKKVGTWWYWYRRCSNTVALHTSGVR